MNLNKAELIGNLAADPTVRELPGGVSVAGFTVVTSRVWKADGGPKKEVEFHPVVAWGQLGQVVAKYLKKGDKVYIDGRLRTRTFQGKNTVKRSRTEIIAQNLIMLGGAKQEKVNDEVIVEEIDPAKV
jgi:single-strand DNA-binding protein